MRPVLHLKNTTRSAFLGRLGIYPSRRALPADQLTSARASRMTTHPDELLAARVLVENDQ
jgi:hypothetical protein